MNNWGLINFDDADATFNLIGHLKWTVRKSFDKNSIDNVRFPIWVKILMLISMSER